MHCPSEVDLILIVHGDTDEELRLSCSTPNVLPKLITLKHEVIWIACHSSISHMGKFYIISTGQKAVQDRRYLAFQDELSIDESNLLFGHLCVSSALSPFLSALRRWPV